MIGARPEIRDQARNKWASILNMLGVDQNHLRNLHGPCPLCGGRDRFRFDDKEGRGTWICNQCGSGDGMDLALKFTGMSFADCAREIRDRLGEATERKPRPEIDPAVARKACGDLWRAALPILDDEVAQYLRSRGLNGPYPHNLRFHPAAEVSNHPRVRTLPAMLARVTGNDGTGVNIHRTYLENGRKAEWTPVGENVPASCRRLMPGSLPLDAAIRLQPHDGKLGVAEGIETALAVMRDFQLPCWALINSTHMERWLVPSDVRELHIFGDNDHKFGGQAAAFRLAHRAAVMPNAPKVFVRIPGTSIDDSSVGKDWADTTVQMDGDRVLVGAGADI
jgi:putative DNA primase/helicase